MDISYENFKEKLASDEFKKLPEEEKRETISKLIHKISKDSNAKAVLYNPITHKSCSLDELMNSIGEEKVIDLIILALDNADMATQSFTKEEIENAFERKSRGVATEEDEQMIKMFNSAVNSSENIQLNKNLTAIFVELITFLQEERNFYPSMGDLLATYNLIASITGVFSEGSSLEKYKSSGPVLVHKITNEMANDIINTWQQTCTEMPDDYMLLCALLEATQKVANRIQLCNAEVYQQVLGQIIEDVEESCNGDCEDCNCHNDNTNGSNETSKTVQPKTYSSKDQDMRTMLKE